MKQNNKKITENNIKTPISELDGITVDGVPFVSLANYKKCLESLKEADALSELDSEMYDELYRKWSYQKTRSLRHECSLKRQGNVISTLKSGLKRFNAYLDRIERTMDIQDNAILYWNNKYDTMKFRFNTVLTFAIASIIGLALTATYICHLEQGWTMPLFDRIDKIVFHQPDNPNAYPMYWVNPNAESSTNQDADTNDFDSED